MRAPRRHAKHDLHCDTVPDPIIEEGRGMYKTFRDKEDACIKIVLEP